MVSILPLPSYLRSDEMIGFLILTELPLFKTYVSRNWPLFSHRSGFVMLGFALIFLGNGVLGNMNKVATSQESLGLPFWRVVIAAGIIALVMGPINILAVSASPYSWFGYLTNIVQSYIFRDTRTHLTARQVRSHGAVAGHKADVEAAATPNPNRRTRYRSFFLGQKRNSLPSYYSHARSGTQTDMSQSTPKKFDISSPIHAHNPTSPGGASSKYSQASPRGERYGERSPELTRPNIAHHPAMTAGQAL